MLATIEEKKRRAAAKNVTVAAESKKRKNLVGPKAVAKKLKSTAIVAAPVLSSTASSAHASGSVDEGSIEGTSRDRADSTAAEEVPAALAAGGGGGLEVPKPSVADPFPNVMGGDSSFEGSEAADRGLHSPAKEAEVLETSSRRPAAVTEVSEDEADSESAARRTSSASYVLQMSMEPLPSFLFFLTAQPPTAQFV